MERFLSSGRDEDAWSLFVMDDTAEKRVDWVYEMNETEIPELLKSNKESLQIQVSKKVR